MRAALPAVGLSYSTHHADYATNDTATAADSHAFLRALFKRYPHLQKNDFYIAGGWWHTYAVITDMPLLMHELGLTQHVHLPL